MKTTNLIFAFILGLIVTTSVTAQSNENQLYYTIKRTVKPDKIDNYIELSKTWANACKEHNYPYSFSVWQSNIYDFYWFYPVSDYNDVTEANNEAWKIVPKIEEGFPAKFYENIEYEEDFFIRYVDSLTYNPETEIESLVYAEWWIHYTKPLTGMQYRKAIKYCVEKQKKANLEYPIWTFKSDIGMNGGSSYIRVFLGKDIVDLNSCLGKMWENLGEEGQKMSKDLTPVRRKFEKIPFWYQKELSYTPK